MSDKEGQRTMTDQDALRKDDLFGGFIPLAQARTLPREHPGIWSCACGMAWVGTADGYPNDLHHHAKFRADSGETGPAHDPGLAMFRPDTIAEPEPELDVKRLRDAVIHAAFDVDGAWYAEDEDGAPILWIAEAGEVLADLRAAIEALDDGEADTPISTVTTPDGQVYRPEIASAREAER